jgi:hypothetical protein
VWYIELVTFGGLNPKWGNKEPTNHLAEQHSCHKELLVRGLLRGLLRGFLVSAAPPELSLKKAS